MQLVVVILATLVGLLAWWLTVTGCAREAAEGERDDERAQVHDRDGTIRVLSARLAAARTEVAAAERARAEADGRVLTVERARARALRWVGALRDLVG